MKVGDIVICRDEYAGIILELDDGDLHEDMVMWAKIMWATGEVTWEDMITSKEDNVFKVINESR